MSGLIVALVAVLVLWQVAVALLLGLLYRQVTLLSMLTGLTPGHEQPADHGLLAGEALPPEVIARVPRLTESGVTYLVWLTSSCTSCQRLAEQLRAEAHERQFPDRLVMLISGTKTSTERMVQMLSIDARLEVIVDPDASEIVDRLGLPASPFAVEVESTVVTGWSSTQSTDDLWRLREARQDSSAHELAEKRVAADAVPIDTNST